MVLGAPLPRWGVHRRSMTHTHGKGKLKQGENVLLCHIPAVSNSSRGGGCTMDTLYLAQASSPTQVNPTMAACRTWRDRANRTNCLGNNCPGGPRGTEGLEGESGDVLGKNTGIGVQKLGLYSWLSHSQPLGVPSSILISAMNGVGPRSLPYSKLCNLTHRPIHTPNWIV